MANSKLILTAATAVLILGASGFAASASERAPAKDGIVVAADDSAKGSGKMGEDSGTQSGDEATTPENDTQKIDQPPRRDPTTGGADDQGEDDVMPPPEDEDEGAPDDNTQE
jgi:hypothetical protein